MASAYKSALRADIAADSDESMSEDLGASSNASESENENESESESNSSEPEEQAKPAVANGKKIQDSASPVELRNRILMLTSRGVSFRHRHLLADLHTLLPHAYKDTKLDTKSNNNYNSALNGLAELNACNYIFFFEGRKHGQDLYLWLAKAPNGPTIKFGVSNAHTMGELGFGGNCLKGGRGIVVFDKSFEELSSGGEHKGLIREMLRGVFCVPPKGVRGMKPFIDRVVGIYGLDGKIWIRVYEIREGDKATAQSAESVLDSDVSLVEVGPRLVLTPIVILEGSFGGPVIYENKQYVSPNQVRSELRLARAGKYAKRQDGTDTRVVKRKALGIEAGARKPQALDDATLFG